jgi:hypothetical protein
VPGGKKPARASPLGRPRNKRTDLACDVREPESQRRNDHITQRGTTTNQPTGRGEEEPQYTYITHGTASRMHAPHRVGVSVPASGLPSKHRCKSPRGEATQNDMTSRHNTTQTRKLYTNTQPSSTQPSSTQPSSTQPSSTQPSSTQPSSIQLSSTQPSSTQPSKEKSNDVGVRVNNVWNGANSFGVYTSTPTHRDTSHRRTQIPVSELARAQPG